MPKCIKCGKDENHHCHSEYGKCVFGSFKCTHPDHVAGESCEDHAVGCHSDCECCCPKANSIALAPDAVWSEDANKVMFWMIKQLSSMGYGYRIVVEGCYDAAVNNYGFSVPQEDKKYIVDKVVSIITKGQEQ